MLSKSSKIFFGPAGDGQPKDYPYKTDDFRGDINTQVFIDWAISQLNEHGLLQQGVRFQFHDSIKWWNRCYLKEAPDGRFSENIKQPIEHQLKNTILRIDWLAVYQAPNLDFAKQLFLVNLADVLLIREGKRGDKVLHMAKRKELGCNIAVWEEKIDVPYWLHANIASLKEWGVSIDKMEINPCKPNSQEGGH